VQSNTSTPAYRFSAVVDTEPTPASRQNQAGEFTPLPGVGSLSDQLEVSLHPVHTNREAVKDSGKWMV